MRPSCSLLASVSATGPSGCRRGISQTYSALASLIQVPDAATSNSTVALPCGREREKGRGKSFPGPPLQHASCRREKQEAGPRRRKPEDWAFPAAIADMSAPRTRLVRPSSSPRVRPGTRISRIRPPWESALALRVSVTRDARRVWLQSIPCRRIENHGCTPPFTLRIHPRRFRHRKLAPKSRNLRLRAFGTQAETGFISSFQRWQATSCPSSVSSAGSRDLQMSMACGQRVWNLHPGG